MISKLKACGLSIAAIASLGDIAMYAANNDAGGESGIVVEGAAGVAAAAEKKNISIEISTGVVAREENGELTVIPADPEDNNPEHINQVKESLEALPPEEFPATQYPFNDQPALMASRYSSGMTSFTARALAEESVPEISLGGQFLISDIICRPGTTAGDWVLSMTINHVGVVYQIKDFHYCGESAKNVWHSDTIAVDIVQ